MTQERLAFHVEQDIFASALTCVARTLPSKATQPILRGVLITSIENGLEISGFDREISTKIRITADVVSPGTILVAGKLAADIVGSLPNKPITVHDDNNKIIVSSGASRFELPPMTIEAYPVLPELPEISGHVDFQTFSQAVSQVVVAARRDETVPMLTGIHIEIHNDELIMAATDRYRLAVRRLQWNPSTPDMHATLLVPARNLHEAIKTLDSHDNDVITIAAGSQETIGHEGLLGLSTKTRNITTRLLDATFPKYQPLLPEKHSTMASVPVGPLQDALRRMTIVAERDAAIKMTFSTDDHGKSTVTLSAGGSDVGSATETLLCDYVGQSLEVAFNPTYLKEGLSSVLTSRVVFCFTIASRPALLTPYFDLPEANEDDDYIKSQVDFTYLLMPVRLPQQ